MPKAKEILPIAACTVAFEEMKVGTFKSVVMKKISSPSMT
jgi:hypothetical protein